MAASRFATFLDTFDRDNLTRGTQWEYVCKWFLKSAIGGGHPSPVNVAVRISGCRAVVSWENLATACSECNLEKGARS